MDALEIVVIGAAIGGGIYLATRQTATGKKNSTNPQSGGRSPTPPNDNGAGLPKTGQLPPVSNPYGGGSQSMGSAPLPGNPANGNSPTGDNSGTSDQTANDEPAVQAPNDDGTDYGTGDFTDQQSADDYNSDSPEITDENGLAID